MAFELSIEKIKQINTDLENGQSLEQIAKELEVPYSTLAWHIRTNGYKVSKRLVPIHALSLDSTQTQDAA
ncbi:MAG: hypothetical protein ABFD54_14910 [Armatimonadota bacterium]|nr:hypothetical protein [bacterium]